MDDKQAKRLGALIRRYRADAGLSLRQLEELTDIDDSQLTRMEQGNILKPAPDNLRRIAEALNIPLADLYALADWSVPSELPSPGPYLRAKYRDLSESALNALTKDMSTLLARHGIGATSGPAPGEDEAPEQPTNARRRTPAARLEASTSPTTSRPRTKKGGKS